MCADYWLSQWRVWTGSNLSHRFQTGDYYENTYPRSDSLLTDVHCSYSATLLRPDRRSLHRNVAANGGRRCGEWKRTTKRDRTGFRGHLRTRTGHPRTSSVYEHGGGRGV